jgi:putative transposase
MCALGQVSRAGFYRSLHAKPDEDPDLELGDALQRVALEFPSYGWPRMTRELRRRGWVVNHKRVYRLMHEDNLLCLRRRKFVLTTDSAHQLPVYPNLAREMTLTGLDQLWVADITYIRLLVEFVYLAVILDAFSRRLIGWALDRTLEDELTLGALRMALKRRKPAAGLVHHSDRGVQYAARDYTALLEEHGIRISMSRRGNPYDNALAESFIKTLKYEEVYRQEYRDLAEARASIPRFLEQVYNEKRLHSALGYLPPVEFEQSLALVVGAIPKSSPGGEFCADRLDRASRAKNFAIGRPHSDDLDPLERPGRGKSGRSWVNWSFRETGA